MNGSPRTAPKFVSLALRYVYAVADATVVCFGLWWLYTVSWQWLPEPVFFVAATVVWAGEFLSRCPFGEDA